MKFLSFYNILQYLQYLFSIYTLEFYWNYTHEFLSIQLYTVFYTFGFIHTYWFLRNFLVSFGPTSTGVDKGVPFHILFVYLD